MTRHGNQPAPATGTLLLRSPVGPVTGRVVWPPSTNRRPKASLAAVLLLGSDGSAVVDRDACASGLSARAQAVVLSLAWDRSAGIGAAEYALGWLADHAEEIDADSWRLATIGLGPAAEAAAALAVRARDTGWPRLARHILVLPDDIRPDDLLPHDIRLERHGAWVASLAGVCACGLVLAADARPPRYVEGLFAAGVPVRRHRLARVGVEPVVEALAADLADLPADTPARPRARDLAGGPLTRGAFSRITTKRKEPPCPLFHPPTAPGSSTTAPGPARPSSSSMPDPPTARSISSSPPCWPARTL